MEAAEIREDRRTDLAAILDVVAEDRRTDLMETRVVATADRFGRVDADRTDQSREPIQALETDTAAQQPAAQPGFATTSSLHIQGL